MRNRDFARSAFLIVLGAGLIGFALKFTTYFENWYWLPTWPNLGDAAFIIVAGLVLLFFAVPKNVKLFKQNKVCRPLQSQSASKEEVK